MVKEIFFYTLTRRPKNDATGTLTIICSKYSLPPLTRHRKGNENPVELAGVELARE